MKTGVNLLRWSLKQKQHQHRLIKNGCKFTPMEFETFADRAVVNVFKCVNLLRWSLKQIIDVNVINHLRV